MLSYSGSRRGRRGVGPLDQQRPRHQPGLEDRGVRCWPGGSESAVGKDQDPRGKERPPSWARGGRAASPTPLEAIGRSECGWVSPLASAPGPGRLKGGRHAHCRGLAQAGGWGGKRVIETPAGSRGTSGGGGSPTATTPSNSAPRPRPLTTRAWRVRVRVTAVTVPGGLRAGWPERGGVGGGWP